MAGADALPAAVEIRNPSKVATWLLDEPAVWNTLERQIAGQGRDPAPLRAQIAAHADWLPWLAGQVAFAVDSDGYPAFAAVRLSRAAGLALRVLSWYDADGLAKRLSNGGMAQQAGAVGDTHTAQHQRAPGHQCVNVPAFANSEIHLKSLLNGQPLRIKK